MNREPFTDVLGLLCLWWRWERGWLPVQGYPTECPSTLGFRASRQYDCPFTGYGDEYTGNGSDETDARGQLAKHIGHIVHGMDEPYRTALFIIARNRSTGVSVWRSPRLPEDEKARMEICAEAIDRFQALV